MFNTSTLTSQLNNITYPSVANFPDKVDRVAARNEYQTTVNGLVSQWKDWLHDEYASDLSDTQHELIYSKAYADGHAGGYSEVEGHYSELSDLATSLLQDK